MRQAGLIYEKWKGFDINSEINFERGKNHFSVIDDLKDQNSYLFQRIIGEKEMVEIYRKSLFDIPKATST